MRKVLILFFLSLSFSVFGQQDDDAFRFSLQECIDYAIKHNITVRQTALNVVEDQVALRQSKADLLPSIDASTNYNYSVGRTINPFNNQVVDQPISQQNLSLNASWVIFNSFRKLNTIRRNKNNVEVSRYDLEATRNNITLSVIDAYTQILFNRELLETNRLQLQTTELQLARTRKLVQAGSLPPADVLQQQAQQASNEVDIANAENNLALAELQLKQLLQIPDNQTLEIVVPEVDVPEESLLPASADAVYEQAVSTLPAIQSADLQIVSARYNVSIAKADFYPSLSLFAGLNSNYSSLAPPVIPVPGTDNITTLVPVEGNFAVAPTGVAGIPEGTQFPVFANQTIPSEFTNNTYLNQLDYNLRRFVGINLSIPIFNNWRTKSSVANAQINLDRAQLNALDQRNQLRQQIEQAFQDAKAAAKSYDANLRQVESLQQAFKNTEFRYQAGGIDALIFNQAKNDLNTAESNLVRAKYQYIFSLKLLDFYQNKPLDF